VNKKAYNKQYYDSHKEYYSEYNKKWRQEHSMVDAGRRYNAKYPEKQAARNAVKQALAKGTLKRLPCEVCGSISSEAHHEDYSKPLEVEWLCNLHHVERRGDAL